MPDNVEKLGIEIDSIVKELASLRELVAELRKIQENAGIAQGKMSEFQKQTEQLRNLRETFSGLKSAGLEMMAMGGGVLFGFKQMGQGFLGAAADAEKYELTLVTLFKSAQKAKEELAWARKFEEVTPYSLKDIIRGTVVMRSYGLDAKKYLGMAGDMAAAFGGDSATLQSAIAGVSKAMASGAGAMDILRESFGITGDQLKKFGWRGKEDIVGFRKALEQLLIDRFGGSMEKLSKTLPAYIEGFRSEWTKFQELVGKPLLEAITPEIAKLYNQVKKLWETGEIEKWVNVVKDIFLGIYNTIRDTIKIVAQFTKPIVEFLSQHPEFAKVAGKIMFIGSALTFGAGAALVFTGHLGGLMLNLVNLTRQLGGAGGLMTGLASLKGVIGGVASALGSIAAVGAAAFVGWKIGEAIRQLTDVDSWLGNILDTLTGIKQQAHALETGEVWTKELDQVKKLQEWLEKEGMSDSFIKGYKKIFQGVVPDTIKETREILNMREMSLRRMSGKIGTARIMEASGFTDKQIDDYKRQLTSIKFWRDRILAEGGWTTRAKAAVKKEWERSFPALPLPKSQKEFYEQLKIQEAHIQEVLNQYKAAAATPGGTGTPEGTGIPAPPGPEGYSLTADTRPQIDNYYYTIHFERDSCQINTLDLTPEKFQAALFEFFKRQSLAPQTP